MEFRYYKLNKMCDYSLRDRTEIEILSGTVRTLLEDAKSVDREKVYALYNGGKWNEIPSVGVKGDDGLEIRKLLTLPNDQEYLLVHTHFLDNPPSSIDVKTSKKLLTDFPNIVGSVTLPLEGNEYYLITREDVEIYSRLS